MGVLEKFFQLTLVLTVMLLFINIFLSTFAYGLTGDDAFGTSINNPQNVDTNNYIGGEPTTPLGSIVANSSTGFTVPQTNKSDWDAILDQIFRLAYGFQLIVGHMAENIDPTQPDDYFEQAGAMIIMLVNIIQVIGVSYLAFALISAFTGGGSP